MVLTNFECWAHGGSNDGFILSSHRRHNSSIDLFNPSSVLQNNNNNCSENNEKNNEMQQMQEVNEQSPTTNNITINSNDQSISNVSHLSSNGYYGFAQICNVDTNNSSSSAIITAAAVQAPAPLPSSTPVSGGIGGVNIQQMMNVFQQQHQQQPQRIVMNVDCITPTITGLASAQQTIAHGSGQQQMDVEQQFIMSDSGVANRSKFSKKRYFVDEDNIDTSAKRFRSSSQQQFPQSQGRCSSIKKSQLPFDTHQTSSQTTFQNNVLKEINHDEYSSATKHTISTNNNYTNMNTSRKNAENLNSVNLKIMTNPVECNRSDDKKPIIIANSHECKSGGNDESNDQMEDLFWSVHGVSNHLILRHLSDNLQDEI